MPAQQGVAHVGFTVTDVKRSGEFYKRLLDAEVIFDGEDQHGPSQVLIAGTFMIGFRTHATTPTDQAFDPTRVGLDHLAIAVTDEAELEKWRARLDEMGATHSGIVTDPFGAHLNAKDPDDIAIEFYVPPKM